MADTTGTTVTSAVLAERIGKPDSPAIQAALATGRALLDDALETAFRDPSVEVVDELVLSVGQAIWDRRKTATSNGGQLTTTEGQALPRSPRDPLASCRAILALYVVPL